MDITQMHFVSTFIWLYNIGAAFIILFLIIQILLISRKLDTDIIRARLFLNMDILGETWKYISIAGAAFAINAVTGFIRFNMDVNTYILWEITEVIFLAAFIAMIYQWYQFVGGLILKEK
ncbi:MAG: hypothetical protein P1P80_02435 [ANME-2 cluster archaeon]|nr:hypothetical protein [ANME-2 cluster archaeon]